MTHAPAIPAANQPVVVTARVHDLDGVRDLTLNYRIDHGTSYRQVPMTDSGTVVLSRLDQGQPEVLDYVDYAHLAPNLSYGSLPDGQNILRQEFAYPTPGSANLAPVNTALSADVDLPTGSTWFYRLAVLP